MKRIRSILLLSLLLAFASPMTMANAQGSNRATVNPVCTLLGHWLPQYCRGP